MEVKGGKQKANAVFGFQLFALHYKPHVNDVVYSRVCVFTVFTWTS
jgi:hypothetical protein